MTLAIERTMTNRTPLSIWAVSDGRAGMENQALGLAEAVARQVHAHISVKRIAISQPFDRLPRWMWGDPFKRLSPQSDPLAAPFPDVWIACGRRTVPLTMAVTGQGPLTVQTQDPRAPLDRFDLIVPPAHDNVSGPNVMTIAGSPNRLNAPQLAAAASTLVGALPPLPRPFAAVLLGGNSKDYQLTDQRLEGIIAVLHDQIAQGFGLLITPSRRTGDAAIDRIKNALPSDKIWIWDGQPIGETANPYFGLLGLAEHILVTEESANMITDAAFTGKPVTLLRLDGGAPKWDQFHNDIAARGITTGENYAPLRETDRVASRIISMLTARGITCDPIESAPASQPDL